MMNTTETFYQFLGKYKYVYKYENFSRRLREINYNIYINIDKYTFLY